MVAFRAVRPTFHLWGLNSSCLVLRIESDGRSLPCIHRIRYWSLSPPAVKVSGFGVAGLEREIAILPGRLGIRSSQNEIRAQATLMRTARTSPGEMAACRDAG